MKRRRRVFATLAALALAVLPVSAAVADDKDPPTCATGQYTSFSVQEVAMAPGMASRVFVYLEGWIGPCPGAPLPSGFRQLPYYSNGTVSYIADDSTVFNSPDAPTTFSGYVGVDMGTWDGGQLVAVCLAYGHPYPVDCLRLNGGPYGMTPPTLERVPVSYVIGHVNPWPPDKVIRAHPDPTCGTCL